LNDINNAATKNTQAVLIALIGESGCGKTAIANALLGQQGGAKDLFEETEGAADASK